MPTPAEITPPPPNLSPIAKASATNWFIANEWYKQTYYAVSDGFRLRGNLGTRAIK